jgi:hypothetical protein
MNVEKVLPKEVILFAEIQGYLADLDAGTRLRQTRSPGSALASFMTEDDPLFDGLLARGKKYCKAESAKRENEAYRSVVDSEGSKNLETVASLVSELSCTVGTVASRYHHRGTIAAKAARLTEFHPVPQKFPLCEGTA